MENNKKILITGITGFLGSSAFHYFSKRGFDVYGICRKQSSFQTLKTFVSDYSSDNLMEIIHEVKPFFIFHASGSASVYGSILEPQVDFNKSVKNTQSLYEAIRMGDSSPIVIYPSSAAVYGNPEHLPITEKTPLNPISPYGYHKRICEIIAENYAKNFNINSIVVRIFSLFGVSQRKLIIWEIFNQFICEKKVILKGTGNEMRDYLSIDHFLFIIEKLMKTQIENFSVINVASGNAIKISEIVGGMKNFIGRDLPVMFQGKKDKINPERWTVDISKLIQRIGYVPNNSFWEDLNSVITIWKEEIKQSE